jgi:hypothetical protein
MTNPRRAVVIGGGIAGPAVSLFLQRGARFDDGSVARGGMLLAADGVGSRVRALIHPITPGRGTWA